MRSAEFAELSVESLLHIGTECAFHGAPLRGVSPLLGAIARASDNEARSHARWLLGVCHASAGDFEIAESVLATLTSDADAPHRWVALGHTTIASVQRQRGQHVAAQGHDETALALSDPVTQFDARIGLAADAIGQFKIEVAKEQFDLATHVAPFEWRPEVRLRWVAAEIALMEDRPRDALVVSLWGAATARQAGAPRHCAKSLLFAGVSSATAGDRGQAIPMLKESLAISSDLELRPIREAAGSALRDARAG